jgi:hypothetical protein
LSITLTNVRKLSTANTGILDGLAQFSEVFKMRLEPASGSDAAHLNTVHFMQRGNTYDTYTQAGGSAGTYNVRFNISNASATVNRLVAFNVGTTYFIALTYDATGHQILYPNGLADQFGSLVGGLKTDGNAMTWGASVIAATPFIMTIDDHAMWGGYLLTPEDVAGLRDGTLTPPDVGGSATWRARWRFNGTPGNTVTVGDSAIANAYGDTAYDIKTLTGTGSAVYSAPLVFEPAVNSAPMVMSSGETVGFRFTAIAGGASTYATAALVPPTVKKNGASIGALQKPWMQTSNPVMLWALPGGQSIAPSDTVTLSAPAAWCNTPVGIPGAMTDLAAVNKSGKSAYGVDTLAKTFKPGWNGAHLGFQNGGVYSFAKNWRYRCQEFSSGTTYDANGRPVGNTSFATINALFWLVGPQNGFDGTMSFPRGLWAVGWDDTNPAQPTTLGLTTFSPLMLSITEHAEYNNPGTLVGGVQVGKVRVFDVQLLSTVAMDAGSNAKPDLRYSFTRTGSTFNFANDVIYGPGDFTPGAPTVLDRSDPYAPSAAFLERFANGVGSLRFIDVFWGYGGMGSESEPEHAFRLTDYAWGLWGGKVNQDAFFASARPWNPAVTPYLYSTLFGHFGEEYNCTLGTSIDAVATVLNITDAGSAPVIFGLRLKAGTELMRVLNVTGTSVTVERGACNTTPASHASGAIQVQYRWSTGTGGTNIPGGQLAELVSATPHKMNAMCTSQAYGAWPDWIFSDGSHSPSGGSILNYKFPVYPTGANTVLMYLPSNQVPWVTLSTTYAQDGTCKLAGKWPSSPAAPVEFGAHMASQFPGCALHFSLPHCTTDSLAWAAWRWVRDNLPADRNVYFEYSNEPWNYIFNEYTPLQNMAAWLYPASQGFEFYVERMTQILAIGRAVWTAAGRDPNLLHGVINSQKGDTSGVSIKLEWAKSTLGYPIDIVMFATYMQMDSSATTQAAYWNYNDNQALDLCMALFRGDPTGYTAISVNMNNVINAYNAAHAEDCRLYGYEGGMSIAVPALSTTLTSGIDASTTSVPVASSAGFVAGTPLLCGSEWMAISSVAGNVFTVARGQFGSTAAGHANASAVRTAWIERSHDLMYNPSVYFLEQEHYGLLQEQGFVGHNTYSITMGSAETGTYYGAYHIQTQQPGYGNGLDLKFDNRLCLATPGKSNSKGATVDQDAHTVSVRGQAFLDWMAGTSGVPIDPPDTAKRVFVPRYPRKAGA